MVFCLFGEGDKNMLEAKLELWLCAWSGVLSVWSALADTEEVSGVVGVLEGGLC